MRPFDSDDVEKVLSYKAGPEFRELVTTHAVEAMELILDELRGAETEHAAEIVKLNDYGEEKAWQCTHARDMLNALLRKLDILLDPDARMTKAGLRVLIADIEAVRDKLDEG